MEIINKAQGYLLLLVFALFMIFITYVFTRWRNTNTKESFLVANREIHWIWGGASVAASWIWAPALFVSVQLAYEKGLAGIFWFTFPNVIALAMFALLAPKIREKLPEGYTLPQYIKSKIRNNKVHKIYLFTYLFYQLMAVTVQLFAGGNLVSLLTGIPILVVMPILALISLVYTLVSGIKASVITDVIQIGIIFVIGGLVLPLTWSAAGGTSSVFANLSGINGTTNIIDPSIIFSLGIVTSIGLIAGAIADQQYWQRSFAIKKNHVKKAFIFGAFLFGLVPIALSTLGFIGANLQIALPENIDTAMIGVQTVSTLLPNWATFFFVIMLLAGLTSTLDSGLSATSSLWITDLFKTKSNEEAIKSARLAMIMVTVVGLIVGFCVALVPQLGLFHLWWIFNAVAATIVIPTILSLYWDKLTANGILIGVSTSLIFGLPLFIYSNMLNNTNWILFSILFIIGVNACACFVFRKKKVHNFTSYTT